MKTILIAKETFTEEIPASKFRFEDCFGRDLGEAVTIPARTATTYKGEKFTARNKAELQSALATGKWERR
jgi:hypothetical protein